MRVLVAGATGLLGTDLCRHLGVRYEVIGWARNIGRSAPCLEQVDVTDPRAVAAGLARWAPAVVIHAAGMADVDGCERDPEAARKANAESVRVLAAGCASIQAVLAAVGTDYVFDGAASRAYREEDPVGPVSHYGRTKLEGEREALKGAPRVVVIRVSGLFGAARANFVSAAAEKLRAGREVPVVTDQRNSPSYTMDLAEGFGRLLERLEREPEAAAQGGPLHGPLHMANTGGATRLRVAEVVADLVGASRDLLRRTTWAALDRPARRPARSELDCGKFARLTGKGLRPWEDAVKAFVNTEMKVCHG